MGQSARANFTLFDLLLATTIPAQHHADRPYLNELKDTAACTLTGNQERDYDTDHDASKYKPPFEQNYCPYWMYCLVACLLFKPFWQRALKSVVSEILTGKYRVDWVMKDWLSSNSCSCCSTTKHNSETRIMSLDHQTPVTGTAQVSPNLIPPVPLVSTLSVVKHRPRIEHIGPV